VELESLKTPDKKETFDDMVYKLSILFWSRMMIQEMMTY